MSEDMSDRLEGLLAKLVNTAMVGIVSILAVVIGGTAYLTRMDSRVGVIESELPKFTAAFERIALKVENNDVIEREINALLAGQLRLQLQIDRVEARLVEGDL